MKEEAEIIIGKYNLKLVLETSNIQFYENSKMVLVLCGIGKIQSAIWTTLLIEKYSPKKLINIWIAGNLNSSVINIWDVVIPKQVHQHDMYLPFDGDHLDYAKGVIKLSKEVSLDNNYNRFTVHNGAICVTGDQFIDDVWLVQELHVKYWADCAEMEAFAFLSAAREHSKLEQCIIIKWISDWADNEAKDAHMSNLELAMNNSVDVLDKIIN